ncbi:MAG: hypothetical protein AB1599_00045 [Planctomycetota bacterium]
MAETPQTAAPDQQAVPAPQPEVIACYGLAWKQLWKNFPMLLLIVVIYSAMASLNALPFCIGFVYSVLVGWPMVYGLMQVNLKAARGENLEVGDLFAGFKNYGNVLLAMLLTSLIICGGLLLLIVPGVIFACKLAFVPFLVMDQKKDAIEAIKQSWNMTGGYSMKIFLLYLLGVPIAIAGLIALCVGIIPASMWISLAVAVMYYAVVSAGNKTAA